MIPSSWPTRPGLLAQYRFLAPSQRVSLAEELAASLALACSSESHPNLSAYQWICAAENAGMNEEQVTELYDLTRTGILYGSDLTRSFRADWSRRCRARAARQLAALAALPHHWVVLPARPELARHLPVLSPRAQTPSGILVELPALLAISVQDPFRGLGAVVLDADTAAELTFDPDLLELTCSLFDPSFSSPRLPTELPDELRLEAFRDCLRTAREALTPAAA